MKVEIHLKDGTRIKRNHVRYVSASTDDNQLRLYKYVYGPWNTRRSVEEHYTLNDVEYWNANQPEKGGW